MEFKLRTEIQLMLVLLFAAAGLIGVSVVLGGVTPSLAQGPATPTPLQLVITDEDLAAFGLPANAIHASDVVTFDLHVVKSSSVTSVTAGSTINYTIVITNNGPGTAQGVIFQDVPPNQLVNINYTFSPGMSAISNGATIPSQLKWLLLNGIPINQSTKITVTGQLTSALSLTVTNTAMITSYNPAAESGIRPNTGSADVWVTGDSAAVGRILYLPYVSKMPTPTPTPTPQVVLAYTQNFEDKNSSLAWYQGDLGSGCRTTYDNGRYRVDETQDSTSCLPPAKDKNNPESPNRTYGEWEVYAYLSEGDSNAAYGLFINGAGADNYYAFRIWPNNSCSSGGGWELQRRKNGSESTIAGSKTVCNPAINRGVNGTNTIRLAHKGLVLSMYVNGTLVGTFTENSSDHRTGTASGVYVRSANIDIKVKFDDFKAYKYP